MENNNINDSSEMPNSSKVYALFYSFFLIPFMLAIFGAMFFFMFQLHKNEIQNSYSRKTI